MTPKQRNHDFRVKLQSASGCLIYKTSVICVRFALLEYSGPTAILNKNKEVVGENNNVESTMSSSLAAVLSIKKSKMFFSSSCIFLLAINS